MKQLEKAEILCVGTELLLGDIVNTNAAFLSRRLAALGIGVFWQGVVGDNPGRLAEELRAALSRADLVVLSGGLGPTGDDLTKEVAASVFGREMELCAPALARIERYFAATGRVMTPNNKKQAMMPKGATVFLNDYGTAPALALETEDVRYFANKEKLPVVKSPCPADGNTERAEMKQLLTDLEHRYKGLRYRLFGAIQRGEVDGFKPAGRLPQ